MADVAEFLRQKGFNDVDIIKGFMGEWHLFYLSHVIM